VASREVTGRPAVGIADGVFSSAGLAGVRVVRNTKGPPGALRGTEDRIGAAADRAGSGTRTPPPRRVCAHAERQHVAVPGQGDAEEPVERRPTEDVRSRSDASNWHVAVLKRSTRKSVTNTVDVGPWSRPTMM